MPEEGRNKVHDQWVQVLQPGVDHERGGRRGYREGERERVEDRVDEHEQELGPELAVKLGASGAIAVVQSHGER